MLLNCARVGGKNRSATFSCEKAGTHSQLGHDQHICIVVDRQGRVAFLEDGNSRRSVRLRGPHALPSTCDCLTSEAWSEPPSSAIYTNVWGLFNLFVHCSPTSGACHRTGSGNQSFAALREAKSGVSTKWKCRDRRSWSGWMIASICRRFAEMLRCRVGADCAAEAIPD